MAIRCSVPSQWIFKTVDILSFSLTLCADFPNARWRSWKLRPSSHVFSKMTFCGLPIHRQCRKWTSSENGMLVIRNHRSHRRQVHHRGQSSNQAGARPQSIFSRTGNFATRWWDSTNISFPNCEKLFQRVATDLSWLPNLSTSRLASSSPRWARRRSADKVSAALAGRASRSRQASRTTGSASDSL